MKSFFTFVGRRFLELGFFILGFPVAVGLFVIFAASWSVSFVPLFAVFILVLLHAMQWVAWFEVKRANLFLRREIRVIDQWFSFRFFSWMGVKERLLSPRSWLTLVYVVVSFVIGVIGFSLSVTALALVVSVFAVPIGAVVAWSGGTVIQGIGGPLSELPIPLPVTLVTIALLVAAVFVGTLVWLLGLLQAHVVNGFLSNGYLPALRHLTQKATNKLRVNEREVQDALNHPQTRESLSELSPREKEVLALMAQGKSNAGIASTLFITEGSVEKHVSNILSKMDLPQNGDQHRRILAVLEYLGIEPGQQEVMGQTSGVTRSD
jgi:DNA-binding CsgD family transcriptional regulator